MKPSLEVPPPSLLLQCFCYPNNKYSYEELIHGSNTVAEVSSNLPHVLLCGEREEILLFLEHLCY